MDGYFEEEEFTEQDNALVNEQLADRDSPASDTAASEADSADDRFMTIVDPLIDKASREGNDSYSSEDSLETEDADQSDDSEVDDSEFDDDMQLDQLEAFMAEDGGDVSKLHDELDDELEDGLGEEDDLVEVLKVPLTASQQALAARRAIEERAEARRMERDLNYLDFELDD